MQTILGAGGALGLELAKVLPNYSDRIRLVSRNPQKVNENDQLVAADLTDATQTMEAVKASEVAYLTAGLPYSLKVWEEQWPLIMKNVILACQAQGTRLVFFDNVYMYDKTSLNHMKEDHPINPPSKKGKVREQVANMLLDAIDKGDIRGLIARSADFYGPSIQGSSLLTEMVFKPLSQGKKANWMGKADKKHAFTYVPDAAKATALLGNTPNSYGEIWHLPTAPDPYTGEEWIRAIAKQLGVAPKYRVLSKGMLSFIGIFSPLMRELAEMVYQNDRDYVFDSSKFETAFNYTPTPYEEGIQEVVRTDYTN